MENNLIAIFRTHYSLGNVLTCDEPTENIDISKSISILTIAKVYNLPEIFVNETFPSGFIELQKNIEQLNKKLCYGLTFTICNDVEKKDEESLKTQSKIRVWMKNSQAKKSLDKIFTTAAIKYFYYKPRLSTKVLLDLWDNNLLLTLPFYSNFLSQNTLNYDYQALPNFDSLKPIFEISPIGLPFDTLLKEKIQKYTQKNNLEVLDTLPIYYYSKNCFRTFIINRCIQERSTFNKPEVNFLSSENCAWEQYCFLTNKSFIK